MRIERHFGLFILYKIVSKRIFKNSHAINKLCKSEIWLIAVSSHYRMQ